MADAFLWGTTSSSTGTEGAAAAADWAAWEAAGRAPASNDGNGWATDYADDAALLASLGVNALRITIEWARLEPEPGLVDQQRIEHERDVLTAVRGAGLEPWVTLHNGSLPGWFTDDEHGFRDERARRYYWPRHIDRCAEWFEDLVAGWVPIEDPIGWAVRGFLLGTRPPGRRQPDLARDAIVGALDANHIAWQLLGGGRAPVMCVLGLPLINAADSDAREETANWQRVIWSLPLRARREGVLDVPGGALLERPDMVGAFDFIGVAYDYPISVTQQGTVSALETNAEQLGEVLRRVADELPDTKLVVAAHGVSTTDDDRREQLLRDSIDELDRARRDGVELTGYFHDTGIEGYDWVDGYGQPRGLVTRDRTIKPSGRYLQSAIPEHAWG